jgi:hypothetical protein
MQNVSNFPSINKNEQVRIKTLQGEAEVTRKRSTSADTMFIINNRNGKLEMLQTSLKHNDGNNLPNVGAERKLQKSESIQCVRFAAHDKLINDVLPEI